MQVRCVSCGSQTVVPRARAPGLGRSAQLSTTGCSRRRSAIPAPSVPFTAALAVMVQCHIPKLTTNRGPMPPHGAPRRPASRLIRGEAVRSFHERASYLPRATRATSVVRVLLHRQFNRVGVLPVALHHGAAASAARVGRTGREDDILQLFHRKATRPDGPGGPEGRGSGGCNTKCEAGGHFCGWGRCAWRTRQSKCGQQDRLPGTNARVWGVDEDIAPGVSVG